MLPVPGIILLLLGISFSKQLGWLDPRIWGAISLGLAIVALWARRSLREREPFIDLRLLATRNVAIANVISALLAISNVPVCAPTAVGAKLAVSDSESAPPAGMLTGANGSSTLKAGLLLVMA